MIVKIYNNAISGENMKLKQILHFLILIGLFFLLSSTAKAEIVFLPFGTQERIKCVQPINFKKEEKTPIWTTINLNDPNKLSSYNLCYKYSMRFFIAGLYLHDDGYVLAEQDDAYRYIPLDNAKITELQEKGILPKPLPEYSIPLSQYLAGYSLWLIIAGLVIGFIGRIALGSLWKVFKGWKYKGKYCLNCDLLLTIKDFSDGKCSACSEPIPD